MDYYEELGVDRDASTGEIRQAYKALVRMLHPDHCGSGRESRLAELQTKRLNGIVALLTDPVQRARYDGSLDEGPAPRTLPRRRPGRRPGWIWLLGPAVCLAWALLFAYRQAPPPVSAPLRVPAERIAAEVPRAPAKGASNAPLRVMKSVLPQTARPVRAAMPAGNAMDEPPRAPAAPPALPEAAPSLPAPPPLPRMPSLAAPEPAPGVERPTLAGDWLFVPSPHLETGQLYPPEYIEMRIAERSGVLRGRYQARYRVTDRAISPAVLFQFEGPGESDRARLHWRGAGGAHGDISLRLLENGALEVTWIADELGKDLGLISGTATLVRKAE